MYYVYELSFDGIIFYIGSTNQPLIRYQQHVSCTDGATHKVIYWIIINNKWPTFKILQHYDNKRDAVNYEYQLLSEYNKLKYKLANIDGNNGNVLDMPIVSFSPKPRFKRNYANPVKEYINNYKLTNNIT